MSKQILIVDDNRMSRLFLSKILGKEYDILEAVDGEAALEVMCGRGDALSAVLLDVVMPKMDGYEVLRRMRDDREFSNIPVIMVTSSDEEESLTKAISLGANDFILKPYNPDIVKQCVKCNIDLFETALRFSVAQKDKLTGLNNH